MKGKRGGSYRKRHLLPLVFLFATVIPYEKNGERNKIKERGRQVYVYIDLAPEIAELVKIVASGTMQSDTSCGCAYNKWESAAQRHFKSKGKNSNYFSHLLVV